MSTDNPALARTATSDIFGKLDDELPPIRIHGDVRTELRRRATANHMNETEYLRNLIYVGMYGIDHVVSLHADRLRCAMGNAKQMPGEGEAS